MLTKGELKKLLDALAQNKDVLGYRELESDEEEYGEEEYDSEDLGESGEED